MKRILVGIVIESGVHFNLYFHLFMWRIYFTYGLLDFFTLTPSFLLFLPEKHMISA